MTAVLNFEIDQGADFSYEITLSDDQTNTSINIANHTFAGALKRAYSSRNVAANLVCTVVAAANGIMNIALPNSVTWNLSGGRFVY
jgi:hypothetical protein